jgi:hypothetical protein
MVVVSPVVVAMKKHFARRHTAHTVAVRFSM